MRETIPRPATLDTLRSTQNPAANKLLIEIIPSLDGTMRQLCLDILIRRKDPLGNKLIIQNWDQFRSNELEIIARFGSQFESVIFEMLGSSAISDKRVGLAAARVLKTPKGLKSILELALNPHHALHAQAIDCLLILCVYWGGKARRSGDSFAIRGPMLETLYSAVNAYPVHKNARILDAWLALVNWDDSLQRGLISDPGNPVYRPLIERMSSSPEPYAMELLAGYLARTTTPRSILTLICENESAEFATEVTNLVDSPQWSATKRRLRELPTLACLRRIGEEITTKNFESQRKLWMLISNSSSDLGQVLSGAVRLAKIGSSEGRHAAAEVLRNCRVPELETLVAELQAAMDGLSEPGAAGPSMLEIAKWKNSPSVVLQKACSEFFKDFTVEMLIAQIPKWPTAFSKAMAFVVGQIDKDPVNYIVSELKSPAPKRRMTALQATHLLSIPEAVSQFLIPLIEDPRLEVRVQVIELLGDLASNLLDDHLNEWLNDASTDIQDAARRAMRRRDRRRQSIENGEEVLS